MINRVFLIVLDSLGIGNAPDAAEFGDKGTNTLKSISHSEYFQLRSYFCLLSISLSIRTLKKRCRPP